ncbi:MAG: hypothetical protein JWN22_2833, partial [Nocardioides sp.]|nr:hypothetical protein [Nocardioides sp.]
EQTSGTVRRERDRVPTVTLWMYPCRRLPNHTWGSRSSGWWGDQALGLARAPQRLGDEAVGPVLLDEGPTVADPPGTARLRPA